MGSKPKGISASRGAAVLGASEFATPFTVWQQIMEERDPGFNAERGYALPPEPESAAIRWGLAFEEAIIELAEREQGCRIVNREGFFSRDGFITCHIDGRYDDSFALHEGKTTSAFAFREKWGQPGTDRVPRAYQVQAQHQMLCTGATEAIVSVLVWPETPDKWESMGWEVYLNDQLDKPEYAMLNKGDTVEKLRFEIPINWAMVLCDMGYFHQYHVKADPAAQQSLLGRYKEFWGRHVLAGIPPEPRNYDDIKRLFPEPKATVIVPDYIERKLAEYKGITEESAESAKRKERLKTIITKYAAAHGGILDDESAEAMIFRNASGEKLGSWSRNKNGSLVFRA